MGIERLKDIFTTAMAIDSPDERTAYIERECADDRELRRRVDSMLAAQTDIGEFLHPANELFPEDDGPDMIGVQLGPYHILEEIGEGGCGIVYMAEQESPVRRKVAVKVIKSGMDTRQVIARFAAERQALALMEHPNIARVLDAGSSEQGRPYFVMELVKGVPITEFCDERKLNPRERIELFIQVCQAVQHAHQKGVIHRDLKPSNVMITMIDGRPVPKVIDFGVAKAVGQRLTQQTMFTRYDQMIGTPAYMSPEQAELSGVDVDTRSDVYALGAMLYELLAGAPPIEEATLREAGLDEIRRTIRETDPPKPSTRIQTSKDKLHSLAARHQMEPAVLRRHLTGDLDWVVMKALEKQRSRRYDTVSAFAADLERFLADEPVEAGPPSVVYRARKFIRRHRAASAAGAVVALAVLGGLALVTYGWIWQSRQNAIVQQLADEKEAERKLAVDNLYYADIQLAYNQWQSGQVQKTLDLLAHHVPRNGDPDRRGWEWFYLLSLCHGYERSIDAGQNGVTEIAVDAAEQRIVSGGRDGSVKVWDLESGSLIADLEGFRTEIADVSWSPDGKRLAVAGWEGKAIVWDGAGFSRRTVFDEFDTATSVEWSPDGERLAIGGASSGGLISILDITSGEKVHNLVCEIGLIFSLAWHPEGGLLVAGESYRGRMQIWGTERGELLHTFQAHDHAVPGLSWSPDGRRLASTSVDQSIKIWEPDTWTAAVTIETAHAGAVISALWGDDGRQLISGGKDGIVRVWQADNGEEINTLRGHRTNVEALAMWSDRGLVVSGGHDGTLKFWNPVEEQGFRTVPGNFAFAWKPDGRELAVASEWKEGAIGKVQVLDSESFSPLFELRAGTYDSKPIVLDWSPDGSSLAAGNFEAAQLLVWDTTSRQEVLNLRNAHGEGSIRTLAWSPDSRQIATVGEFAASPGEVNIWNVETGNADFRFREHDRGISSAVWSPDGRWIASKGSRGVVLIWSPATGDVRLRLNFSTELNAGKPFDLSWSPNGGQLAAGGGDGNIVIWDSVTGEQIRVLAGHTSVVRSLSWSPYGSRLVSAAEDRTARVWNPHSGRELLTLPNAPNLFPSVSWSPDGQKIGLIYFQGLIFDASRGYKLADRETAF